MTPPSPLYPTWPTEEQLLFDPERGILALLDAALDLATRQLVLYHPAPHDPEAHRCHSHRVAARFIVDARTIRSTILDYLNALDDDHFGAGIPDDDFPF